MRWRHSSGNLWFEECTRCGQSGRLVARERQAAHERVALPASDREIATTRRGSRDPQSQWTDRVTGAVVTRAERDAEIVRQHIEERGVQLITIAARWGITPQRVGQICNPPVRRRRHEGSP